MDYGWDVQRRPLSGVVIEEKVGKLRKTQSYLDQGEECSRQKNVLEGCSR